MNEPVKYPRVYTQELHGGVDVNGNSRRLFALYGDSYYGPSTRILGAVPSPQSYAYQEPELVSYLAACGIDVVWPDNLVELPRINVTPAEFKRWRDIGEGKDARNRWRVVWDDETREVVRYAATRYKAHKIAEDYNGVVERAGSAGARWIVEHNRGDAWGVTS